MSELSLTLARLLTSEIEFTYTAPSAQVFTHADPTEIEQIIVNLVVNASHAVGERGRITVSVQPSPQSDAEEDWLELQVEDTGHGIPATDLERIFEPFYSTKGVRGYGLGLSTIRELVRNMSGHVEVQSSLGKGTRFTVRLRRLDEARLSQDDPRQTPRALLSGTELVLVVDDEEHIRRTATGVLVRFGYRVLSAKDGVEALAVLEESGPVDALEGVPKGFNARPFRMWANTALPMGRVLLLAGRARDAVPYLETAARDCKALEHPLAHVQARVLLGRAKEELGETKTACKYYREVVARWGKTKSVSAYAARARIRDLRCSIGGGLNGTNKEPLKP